MTEPTPDLGGFDCAVVIATPNAEFNPLLGVPPYRMRHPDHRFEWDRSRFRRWCERVTGVAGYTVRIVDIAGRHPTWAAPA